MTNPYYTPSGAPATNADGSSATMRAEFASIEAGLDKLPTLTSNGDKAVFVNAGGTALTAVTAATARTNLGLTIGTNVQAYDAGLTSFAATGTAADKIAYTTGVDTWAETTITAAGRALIDDASASNQRATLGSTSVGDAVFVAATAAAARTAIGAVIGTNVQAYDAGLTSFAATGTAADKMVYSTAVDTWAETPVTAGGRALLQSVIALKTSDQLAMGTAYADVTETGLAVAANTTYAFEFSLICDADATTTGIDVACNGPAGATAIYYTQDVWLGAANQVQKYAAAYDSDSANTSSQGTAKAIYTVKGVLVNGATAGTLIARAKREAVGTGPNVRAGSYGILTKLS